MKRISMIFLASKTPQHSEPVEKPGFLKEIRGQNSFSKYSCKTLAISLVLTQILPDPSIFVLFLPLYANP
jgi:hypothetical protein